MAYTLPVALSPDRHAFTCLLETRVDTGLHLTRELTGSPIERGK